MFHPEMPEEINKIAREFEKLELVDVFCAGCNKFVKMNSVFAKHLQGEIKTCAKCRNLQLK
jgi:NAD-dependent SIR2 family protein deacetylase